ncbi:MAG: ATP-binding protein [Acidimicrobiales bacterium]
MANGPGDRYIRRIVDDELDALLPALPAVALEGAKAVGKTATAARRARTVYALDQAAQRAIGGADPARLVIGPPPILIDEWQLIASSWDLVRRAVDEDPSPGRFLLTGSATPQEAGRHSGAGRIVRIRMRPLTLAERNIATPTVSLAALLRGDRPPIHGHTSIGLDDYVAEICRSGFPALRGLPERALRSQLDGYIDRIVDRDIPELHGRIRNPARLRHWMAAYAAATATTASYDTIRDAATPGERDKPARATAETYRDILERLWILDPIPAWSPFRNHLRRLGSSPKHHLVDPALAARLLDAGPDALIQGRAPTMTLVRDATLLGQLFESLVSLDVKVDAQNAEAEVGHLRTHGGDHEVDLIVQRRDGRVVGIEVKLSQVATAQDGRHLRWLAERLGDDLLDAVIVTTGPDAYRRPDGIAVVPAALLGP